MAKKRDFSKQEDLPQFNYRHPGEPETLGTESKEDPDAEKSGQRRFPKEGSAPKTKSEQGLSEMAGMSEPKTQEELDNENTWSPAR